MTLSLSETTMTADPAAVFARLRAEQGHVAWVELEPGVGAWLVMGYDEVLTIARRERLYSRDARNWRLLRDGTVPPDSPLGPMMFFRDNVIGYDGAAHGRLRRPLDAAVGSIDQRRMRRSVERICGLLIGDFAVRGRADLVADYAVIVPMLAIADLFGLDTMRGHELLVAMQALFGSAEDAQDGNRRFEELLGEAMADRRRAPADDLTTALLHHPDLRGDSEVLQSMVVMVSAGYHTTISWIAQSLRLMLTDPRFAARVRGGRLGVDEALDEVLWRDPPMCNMPARYALRDTELGGRPIRRGDALVLGLAAANHDPRVHGGAAGGAPGAEPGNRSHLAWSAGPHSCPGRVPARLITRTAVETVLHRLPGLCLTVPADGIPLAPSPWTRCPASLPVSFPTPDAPPEVTHDR
ncbi:cytochrome P450 [Actinocorallia populi]|uniref:cytochrome P450 n=1 Tax=Actinocorallia populi TaxID=2079200 RepID=UPI0018E57A09|nr:cytochrome P450 [Actinocorallia populi]